MQADEQAVASIEAQASPVTESDEAVFRLTRTRPAAAQLAAAASESETGKMRATIADVSADRSVGAPARTYRSTLVTEGDGEISFGLVADQECGRASDGACAKDGTLLSAVPAAARTIGYQTLNEAPALTGPATVEYAENGDGAVGTYVPTGLADDSTVWSLSGHDTAAFALADGVLEFAMVADYEKPADHDQNNVYTVTVTAADATPTPSAAVTVTVTDVNDPSVVVIMADDVGYESFGSYGSTQYETPRLDEIAAVGTRFTRAYSKPVCTPTRVAIMTGKSNVRNYRDGGVLLPSECTFADLFSEAGYATAIAGKWQLHGWDSAYTGSDAGRGFDTYCLWHTTLVERKASRYWEPKIECDGAIIETDADDYGPDIFVDFLEDFIETNQRRPFLAYYPMVLPHIPYGLPPGAQCENDNDKQCIFEKMVNRVDHNVGRIYDKLDTLGLLDNTVLLFTSDNGAQRAIVSQLGERTIYGDKKLPTDGGTRVPLIAHVPGNPAGAGRVVDDLVDLVDVMATIAEAAGLDNPDCSSLDGVSFWPQLQGNLGQPRQWIYTYYFPEPYVDSFDLLTMHTEVSYAHDKQLKLYSTGELFDYAADPLELYPLAEGDPDHAAARTKLQAVLDSMPSRGAQIDEQSVTEQTPGACTGVRC